MASNRGKDLVAFGAVVAASVFGTWLFLRTQLDLGAGWTDGTQRFEAVRGERIRYAVWDTPAPFGGDANGADAESRPAISPDGRWLVFAVGERGLNADLWVAELVSGEPTDARPLSILNTERDELAPAFGADGLYFASDRNGAAFGLDLWRAPFANGVFGDAAPIGSGINGAADETDPCPVPGSRDVLFASNRERGARTDFDLYVASPSLAEPSETPQDDDAAPAQIAFGVANLSDLNTPFDEREPALTSDGRTLIFATDRDGTIGGFDLYRSFLEDAGWLPSEPLVGVNTWRSERGPLLSADGFSLFFDVSDDEERADLWRAHSKELFRVPTPPLSLQEILTLLSLFLLAILAWLSKRWRALDVLFKCFLISLLVHLALLWYLREVYPESGPVDVAGDERVFRVRLAPAEAGTPADARERGGELQLTARTVEAAESAPSRAESGVELAAVAPSQTAMALPERALEAPARRDAELGENRSVQAVEPSMQEHEAPFERFAENAPGLALHAQEPVAAPTASEATTPNRAATTAEPLDASPSMAQLSAARTEQVAGSDAPGPVRLTEAVRSSVRTPTEVAQPSETFEARRAEAPAMVMPEATVAAAPARQSGQATRRSATSPTQAFEPGEALPASGALADLTPTRSIESAPAGPRVPTLENRVARGDPSVDLRTVHEAPVADARTSDSVRFDATRDLAQSDAQRSLPSSSDPERFDVSPSRSGVTDAAPVRSDLAGIRPVRAAETTEMPSDSAHATVRPRDEGEPAVAIRDVEEEDLSGASSVVPEPRHFDPVADLAPNEPARFRPTRDNTPKPQRFERDLAPAPVRRSFSPTLASVEPPAPVVDEIAPSRMEHTPYKNRFGDEKLRALEEFGGGVETERAVAAGLAYLASIQSNAGHWGDANDHDDKYGDVRVGKTGLSLLAFLGAGHTPNSNTEYADVSDDAVRFLLAMQDEGSGHFGNTSAYGHGIATYALAECLALTQDERIRGPLERAIQHVLAMQDKRDNPRMFGGWGYYYHDGRVWNGDEWPRVSVTAWQVMALESAKIGGLEIPDAAFDAAEQFLLNAWDSRREAFRYNHDPARLNSGYPILPASTPAALFGLSLLGVDASRPELEDARRFVLRRAPSEYRYTGADDFVFNARGNLYFWYYGTLAMFRVGGDAWSQWNSQMKDTLLDGQQPNGSWEPLSTYAKDFAGDDAGDHSYSTAMCVLTLEVYYRYFTPLLSAR